MHLLIIFIFTIICCLNSFSQNENLCFKPKKKAKKYFKLAEELNFWGENAYQNLLNAIKIDSTYLEAYSVLAEINLKKYDRDPLKNKFSENLAIKYLQKIVELCPKYRDYEALFYLAGIYYQKRKYKEAKKLLSQFLAAKVKIKSRVELAKQLLDKVNTYFYIIEHPVPFSPHIVQAVSTDLDEYLPTLSPDNNFMFFTRRFYGKRSIDELTPKWYEDFVQSRRLKIDSFSRGIPMPKPFNLQKGVGGATISIDNKEIFITIVNLIPVTGNCKINGPPDELFANGDIYYTHYIDGHWSELISIGNNINSPCTWEGQPSLAGDNKTLYFVKAGPPSETHIGGMDIYKTIRQDDGSWSDPENLGPVINTPGNEKTPFIHTDSKTLYFSSDYHTGIGGYDIFYSRQKNDGTWTKPKNIGYPINTEDDEHGFIVSLDGKYGYFSSNKYSKNHNLDIISFKLPEEVKPKKVIFVKGELKDDNDNPVKNAKVEIKSTVTGKKSEAVVDKNNGNFVAAITIEKDNEDFLMVAKKKGYAFTSAYISSDIQTLSKPVNIKLNFNKIEEGKAFRLNDINFATNSYELNKKAMIILDEFVNFLKENKDLKIAIYGHTDNIGSAMDNLILSKNRARVVYEYLINEGINASRLTYNGFGESKPIADNNTEEGRAKNRRTEFVIINKK